MLAFIQTRPPRMIAEKWSVPPASCNLRAFNLDSEALKRSDEYFPKRPRGDCRRVRPGPPGSWRGVGRPQLPRSRKQYRTRSHPSRCHYAADAILGFVVAGAALLAGAALAGIGEGC